MTPRTAGPVPGLTGHRTGDRVLSRGRDQGRGRGRGGSGRGAAGVDPQSFDHLPARYDRIATLTAAELRTWLISHLPTRAHRALDAGCGTGLYTGLLADRCNEVTAVDKSAPMIEFARAHRNRGNIRWTHADLHTITPDTDGTYDVVLSTHVLHYLPDLTDALHHLRTLTRPGGTVVLVDTIAPHTANPHAASNAAPGDGPGNLGAAGSDAGWREWVHRPARLRTEAWRTFRADLRHSRRPASEAVELLRLSLDPDWINHRSTDRLLTAAEWDTHTRAVFPGATTRPLTGSLTGSRTGVRTLHWQAPEHRAGR